MDASTIKSHGVNEGRSQDTVGGVISPSASGLPAIFATLLQGAASHIDSGLDPLAIGDSGNDGATVTDPSPAVDDKAYEHRDKDRDDRVETYNDDGQEDYPEDEPKAPRADGNDDFGRQRATDREDNQPEASDGDQTQSEDTPPEDANAAAEDGADDSPASNPPAESQDEGETPSAENGGGAAPGQAEAILAGLAAIESGALPPQASNGKGTPESQRQNAQSGLGRALSNVSGAAAAGQGDTGSPQLAAQSQQGKTSGQAQAKAPAQTATTQAGNTQAATPTVAAQAQGLAEKAGNTGRTVIKVNVTNEANTLVSQPASNLGSASVLAAVTQNSKGAKNKAGGSATSNANSTHGSSQAGQQAAVAVAPGQGQQTSPQAALAQFAPTAAAGTGGPAQGALQANSAAQPLQAGGDFVPGTASAATTGSGQTQQAAPQAANAAPRPAANAAVTEQITVQIAKAVQAGVDRLTIQLKPASMGRIEVQMEIAQDGRVSAVIIADNKDTLDLLQKDAKELARALADAGLQADSDSLNFSLRGSEEQQDEQGSASAGAPKGEPEADETETLDETLDRLIAGDTGGGLLPGRVDIRA